MPLLPRLPDNLKTIVETHSVLTTAHLPNDHPLQEFDEGSSPV